MKTSLSEALILIDSHIQPKKTTQYVPLMKSRGRVCARIIKAKYSVPLCDISMCDGYALSYSDMKQDIVHVNKLPFVTTGEKLPKSTFCVIEQESIYGEQLITSCIRKREKNFIKPKGEDVKKDDILVEKGESIGSFDIANLATQGISEVEVLEEVRFAYLGVGDELIDVEEKLQEGKTYNSNSYTMASRAEMFGARTGKIQNIHNDINAIKKKIQEFTKYDAIITTGGMSESDAIYRLLDSGEFKIIFRGVSMSPAGLTALSFYKDTPLLHLPGLPMSALLGFEILGSALIKKFYGKKWIQNQHIKAIMYQSIENYYRSQRVIPGFFDGKGFTPMKVLAGMSNVLNNCNGYILPQGKSSLKKDDEVLFFPFKPWQ